jgi:hypothetical protein
VKTVTLSEAVALARDLYAKGSDNNVEIDPLTAADLSQANDGCWVRAWVWLYDVEVKA